ncbi:ABC transporter ATP-binding protein [Proteinivorax tanatarense]|uniref:ABC transporter ATP-binding protein n=1 Tax=Proteinivorax tanatarense TaxID=1260629 RepID=A0AAU7VNX6_9FIRM
MALKKGDCLGIIGESGSGKTSLGLSILGLVDKKGVVKGEIYYNNVALQSLSEKQLQQYRWKEIAMVFQNTLDVLNPVMDLESQIEEVLKKHTCLKSSERKIEILRCFDLVGLDKKWIKAYPHQLSGGMRQRFLIAMAIICSPKLLIVDEPSTALDSISKEEILKLLERLQSQIGFSLIIISHDFQVIQRLSQKVMVTYRGQIIETGLVKEVLRQPQHPYTQGFINSSLEVNPYGELWGIPEGEVKGGNGSNKNSAGCLFYDRCYQRKELCENQRPTLNYSALERRVACNQGGVKTLLEGKKISKTYFTAKEKIRACQDVSIKVRAGEVVSLVGQSGSGKTTLANCLSGFLTPDEGEVFLQGNKLNTPPFINEKNGIQIVFQDPFSATNGKFSITKALAEPLYILGESDSEKIQEAIYKALKMVQLPREKDFLNRRCSSLSGGQRQRVAIARALIMEPKILIADEISSMLDPSTKANILRLLKGLQNQKGFSMLYITHDLNLARKISNLIYVMKDGRVIESGTPFEVIGQSKTDYGKRLFRNLSC